ncbi:hypothetical protein CEXT_165651 [Caerostris extrusa]|uniref:Uncharacterized protein n=1 Tax=Caerostris extrusa TaxID=172846 RepID=A0AAV4SLC8_CAEEX|nr:hypothetical protein CEXT_165651 [Caerostris extrusa]
MKKLWSAALTIKTVAEEPLKVTKAISIASLIILLKLSRILELGTNSDSKNQYCKMLLGCKQFVIRRTYGTIIFNPALEGNRNWGTVSEACAGNTMSPANGKCSQRSQPF